ncbi:ABC transporter permease [Chelatococcus asaccharovorans]|uniref:ABC transporter permease n=1 Tax=Chelatococcus asaccharovorans TaxID=28210 RepID=UPI00224C65E2|nr:ABC transporter permease [Chelatococcus asaccharovorans]CAH1655204.1 Glutathione transport system permease protein GsiC [Chelatococcus asaccharovorans]CAH1685499.1 Glutathione transport system permease protein GsiC [Chelatococcus asaccharovorans]
MLGFVLKRLLQAIPVLLITSLLIFVGMRLSPGDPATMLAGNDASAETIAAVRSRLGLDQSYATQYLKWLGALLTGDLGRSMVSGLPVSRIVGERIAPTLELATGGLIASLLLGGVLGTLAGLQPNSPLDRMVSAVAALGLAAPMFWTGMLLVAVFGVALKWLPPAGRVPFSQGLGAALASLAMPVATLAIANAPVIMRFLRDSIQETRRADYVRAAHAKGLSKTVVARDYIVRNSLIPTVTAAGILLGNLIGGAALVEIVFSWPGMGSLLVSAMGNRDYSVIQAVLLIAVFGFVFANLIVDLLYGLLNPRIRHADQH